MSFYDDASLIFDAGAAAGKDGKAYSVKPIPEYGPDLVTNGTFDTDSDWNKGTGWTISGGTANCDNSPGSIIRQNNAVPLNTKLYVSLEVTNYVSGTFQVKFAPVAYDLNVTKNGIYTLVTDGDNSVNGDIQLVSQGFIGSVDNISVREVISPAADFTFTRGTNLTATRVGKDGYIEKGRENLLLQSNQFDTSPWTFNGTLTGGQTGYDGSSDAWLISNNITTGPLGQARSYSGVQTLSAYFKKNSTYGIRLYIYGTVNTWTWFDLNTGEVEGYGGNYIDSSIEAVGDDWWRCSMTFDTTTISPRFYVTDNAGTQVLGNVTIQDAQLEYGLVATDYIETGATTATAGLLEDEPRFDYTGGGCPALLLEPSSTNKVPHSEYFEASDWNTVGTVTLDFGYEAPDGTNSAYKVSGTTSSALYLGGAGIVAGDTRSIWAKTVSGTGTVDLLTYNANTDNTFTVTNEWQRFELTGSPDAVGQTNIYAVDFRGFGNTLTEVLLWGAQAEAGTTATSYIPTYGISATRDTEVIPNFTAPDTNTNAYTFFAHDSHDLDTNSNRGPRFRGISNSSNMGYYTNAGNKYFFCWTNSGSGTKAFTDYDAGALTDAKYAFVIDNTSNTAKLFLNGSLVKSVTLSVAVEAEEITFGSGAGSPNRIPQVIYFPTALSNNDSEILTGATSYSSFAAMATSTPLNYTLYE
jgi:hypothetical protein